MTFNYSFRRAVLLLLISGIVQLSANPVVAIENSAVSITKNFEYQLLESAKMTLKEKRYKEAEDQFQQLLTKYPKSVFAPAASKYIDLCRLKISQTAGSQLLESAKMTSKESRYNEEEEQFQKVIKKYQESGPAPATAKFIDRRIEMSGVDESHLFQSAKISLKEKRYQEAEVQFQEFNRKYPKSGLAPAAIKYIDLCRLKMSETYEYQLIHSAKIALEEKRYREAEDQFQKFLKMYPKSGLVPAVTNYIDLCRLQMSKLRPDAPKALDEPLKEAKNENNKANKIPEISEPPLLENILIKTPKIPETAFPENNIKMILKIPDTASTVSTPDALGNDSKTMPVTEFSSVEQVLEFREYLASALKTNSSHLINSSNFKREYANSVTNMQGYSFNVSLDSGATAFYDTRFNYGANVALNASKTLYDGGKKQILEKELEIVRLLSDAHLIDSANNTTLIAVNLYATFYYLQEELSLLKLNFSEYQNIMRRIETNYQKGTRFSSFDYYSSKGVNLSMERALLSKKAELLKAETAFRQFANINTNRQIRLKPLSISRSMNLVEIEKAAVLNNSSIKAARLQKDLQLQKIDERNAESGLTVRASSGLGAQFNSSDTVGANSTLGAGFRPIATVGLTASFPIYDGGVKRSNILAEEFEALKQKLELKRTTEDIIKRVNDIYADYILLEKDLEISRELIDLNRKRTEVAMERFDKGLEEYRSVREAWSDSILTEIEVTRQNTILQKLMVDITILSGKKLFDL